MGIIRSKLFRSIFLENWRLAILSILLAVCVSLLEVLSNAIVLPLTQVLSQSESLLWPDFIQRLTSFLGISLPVPTLRSLLGLLAVATVIKNLFLYASSLSINAFMLKGGEVLRYRCLQRFLKLEIPFYESSNTGTLLGYVNEQAQRSEKLFSSVLEFARELIFVSLLACFLISLSISLTFVTTIGLLIAAFALKLIIAGVQKNGRTTASALNVFSEQVSELLNGIRVIKIFSSEDRELAKVNQALRKRYRFELNAYKFNSAVHPLTETTGILVLIFIIVASSLFSQGTQAIALPVMLTYILTLLRILPRVNHLNGLRSGLSLLSGSFEKIDCFLLETKSDFLADGYLPYSHLKSSIKLNNVTFSYPGARQFAINDLTLEIPKGKVTALVGHSGSGKSTVIDLILRLYDPDSGSISINNTDLKSIDRSSWHHAISVVSQDTFLFNTTVAKNISYGAQDASREQIAEAARKAYALEFINQLPHGLDTVVGNRGSLLSGGQRQRIAIARAILCDPDILILDEATSALDSSSERIVQRAINEVSRDRTVIVIAHRLSTIEHADNIVVMRSGKILEQGTHHRLLELKGEYHSLSMAQSSSMNALA